MNDDEPERRAPAERRLDEHLAVLRASPPQPGQELAPRVLRDARWQRVVRAPLRVAGMIAAAAIDGLAGLIGGRRR